MDSLRPWLSRSLAAYALIALVLAVAGWRLAGSRGSGQPDPVAGASPPAVEHSAVRLTVHVAGAVARPGVYRLPSGARVQDAVRRAGGPRPGAQADMVNLAAPLQDGQQVVIPRQGEGAPDGGPLSLSRATPEQLEQLDGIGPALAARIIEWRRSSGGFANVDQLSEVSGIGPARLESLRGQVVP